jgi:hypothetical protein
MVDLVSHTHFGRVVRLDHRQADGLVIGKGHDAGEDGGIGGRQGLVGSCMGGNGEMAAAQKLVSDAALRSEWAGHRERRIESQLLRRRGNGASCPIPIQTGGPVNRRRTAHCSNSSKILSGTDS